LASLAERYLGDPGKAWWIAEWNNIESLRPGQDIVIPSRPRNPLGIGPTSIQTVPVLCYHRFGPRGRLSVTPQAFEQQMDYLAKNGFRVITLAQLAAFLAGNEPLPKRSVLITIDDGYRSTYDVAFPILKRYGFPATVFLYSDFVGLADALTWSQMQDMMRSGLVDIQPHSKSHANLTVRLPRETDAQYRDRVRNEIETPIAAIKTRLGVATQAFAYPYGDVTESVADVLARGNVRMGFTVTSGGNPFFAYPLMLRRTMVYGEDDLAAFRAKLAVSMPRPAR
jgi:peptidoglycan/xylan/chitin deacetylase (PgdA/CDA1 family)